MKIFIFLFSLFLCGAALALPPQKVTLHYNMSQNGSVMAEVTEMLEHDGKLYAISSEVKGKGLYALAGTLKRSSRGNVTRQGLQPLEFHDQRGNKPAMSAKFDWVKGELTQERDGKSETVPIPAAPQDTLSMAYNFSFAPPAGKEVTLTRADGRGLTPFRFTIVGTEKLATPAGEMQALHLSKVRDGPEDKSTEIWLASERNLLPVRVLIVEKDGTRIDQVVTQIGN